MTGNMRRVIIIPMEGLCNRMRVMASGVTIARHFHARTEVYWNRTANCACQFADLFEPVRADDVEVREGGGLLHAIASRYNLWVPLALRRVRYGQVVRCFDMNSMGNIYDRVHDVEDLVLESHSQMAALSDVGELFVPRKDIRNEINRTTASFGNNVVGVHVRRTDNALSKAHSPLETFMERMESEVQADDSVRFFLATDDVTVRDGLSSLFGGRLMYRDNKPDRSSEQGMRDALVDLYSLSRTRKVLGSYWSSFSAMASEIGNIPLII